MSITREKVKKLRENNPRTESEKQLLLVLEMDAQLNADAIANQNNDNKIQISKSTSSTNSIFLSLSNFVHGFRFKCREHLVTDVAVRQYQTVG